MLHDPISAEQVPTRIAKEWLTGDVLSRPEQELMYALASERLIEKEYYTPDETTTAVYIARSLSCQEIATELHLGVAEAEIRIDELYAKNKKYADKVNLSRLVIQWGLRQLIVRSMQAYEPDQPILKHWQRSQITIRGRFRNRMHLFGLTKAEQRIALLEIQNMEDTDTPEHIDQIFAKTNSDNPVNLMHRLYGIS